MEFPLFLKKRTIKQLVFFSGLLKTIVRNKINGFWGNSKQFYLYSKLKAAKLNAFLQSNQYLYIFNARLNLAKR